MQRGAIVDLEGEILQETELAYLFYDGRVEQWLPKSQCDWHEEPGIMSIPAWLALDKGLL
jgi:hypothetical protein